MVYNAYCIALTHTHIYTSTYTYSGVKEAEEEEAFHSIWTFRTHCITTIVWRACGIWKTVTVIIAMNGSPSTLVHISTRHSELDLIWSEVFALVCISSLRSHSFCMHCIVKTSLKLYIPFRSSVGCGCGCSVNCTSVSSSMSAPLVSPCTQSK